MNTTTLILALAILLFLLASVIEEVRNRNHGDALVNLGLALLTLALALLL